MADNDNRNPWLDWGEPVEQTGKSWDEWGEPVEQTGKSWDEWGEPAPERTPTPSVPVSTPTPSVPASTPVEPSSQTQSLNPGATYKAPVEKTIVEDIDDAERMKVVTTKKVEEQTHTTSGSVGSGEGTGSSNNPTTSNSGGVPIQSGTGNQGQGANGGSPSAPVPTPVPSSEPQSPKATVTYKEPVKVTVVEEYKDENGDTKVKTVRTVEDQTHTTTVPIRSGEGTGSENSQATSYSGGSPSSNVPKTITQTYTDEDGERRTITVPNPNYNNGESPDTNDNPEHYSGGVPLQSGVGNAPVGAGGGSPSIGGGSGSAANTTWGTETIQQYSDEIPNHDSGNPDSIPKTIRQPYKDENGDIQYRTVPNPAYYAGQSGSGSGGSGSGSGGSIPFAGGGSGSGNNKKTDYYSDYAAAHKAIKGANYRYSAEGIRNEVESLQSYYNGVMNSMDGWTGMAKDSYTNAANSIKGKLTVIMNNINESLIPASEAAEDLDELLTRLEEEDKNLHLLLEELNKREVEYQGALTAYNHEPSTITETTTNPTTGEKETKSVANPKKETLRQDMNEAKKLLDLVQEKVEAQQQLEAELCEEIDEKIELIRTLQANIETMNSYVNPFGSNYHNISSHENINNNYDDIVNDLDFSSPSIPNPSDYHDGDNVAFDDSYGEVVTITQGHGNGGTGGGSMPIVTNGGPSISNDVAPANDYPMITDAPTPPVEPPTSK